MKKKLLSVLLAGTMTAAMLSTCAMAEDVDYSEIKGLRIEAAQKLNAMKPENVGRASRISGVSPADCEVLIVWLEQRRRRSGDAGETV